jgi:cell division protein FtsB
MNNRKGINMKKQLGLNFIWKLRTKLQAEGDKLRAEGAKLRAEGDKLRAEGAKLRAEGDKLRAEGDKLRAEGDKLWAEGDKLRAEGDKLWAESIIELHGNIILEWKYIEDKNDYECHLENGEIYKP